MVCIELVQNTCLCYVHIYPCTEYLMWKSPFLNLNLELQGTFGIALLLSFLYGPLFYFVHYVINHCLLSSSASAKGYRKVKNVI